MIVKDKSRRLFFALWPSAQVRKSMADTANPLLHEMSGRNIPPLNFHITLHFIGSVTDDRKNCLHQSAQSVIFKPFDISLDRFGFFSKAKIFWMAAQVMPLELKLLHQNLGEALSACDFQIDPRPYSPHVSLLRKARKTAVDYSDFSIDWHVDEFVLVESTQDDSGIVYRVIERYSILSEG